MPDSSFATLGRTGRQVSRLGISGTYRPGKQAIHAALDAGVNYFFCYGFDSHTIEVLRDLPPHQRDTLVVATGSYNLGPLSPDIRRTCEKRLRTLRTGALDVFLFLGLRNRSEWTSGVEEALVRLREEGKVRAMGVSTHNRALAGELARDGAVDVLMVRYNAAHRGAEQDIFAHLAASDPGVVGYTATRWRYLLRRPRGWPRSSRVPDAADCYRFVLSNPAVDVCMSAPSNLEHLRANLAGIRKGPMAPEETAFMRDFGDAVYRRHKRFL